MVAALGDTLLLLQRVYVADSASAGPEDDYSTTPTMELGQAICVAMAPDASRSEKTLSARWHSPIFMAIAMTLDVPQERVVDAYNGTYLHPGTTHACLLKIAAIVTHVLYETPLLLEDGTLVGSCHGLMSGLPTHSWATTASYLLASINVSLLQPMSSNRSHTSSSLHSSHNLVYASSNLLTLNVANFQS